MLWERFHSSVNLSVNWWPWSNLFYSAHNTHVNISMRYQILPAYRFRNPHGIQSYLTRTGYNWNDFFLSHGFPKVQISPSLWWYRLQHPLYHKITYDVIDHMYGGVGILAGSPRLVYAYYDPRIDSVKIVFSQDQESTLCCRCRQRTTGRENRKL